MSKNTPEIRINGFEESWTPYLLKEICELITVGIANSATHAYSDNGIVMFRNQNIKENHLDDSEVLYINEEFEKKYVNKRLKENDLLITRTGYPGIACVVPKKHENSQTFTTLIARVKDGINPDFTCRYINSNIGKRYFKATQIGGGQKNSGAGILSEMPIKIPKSPDEQLKLVDLFTEIDKIIFFHQQEYDKLVNNKKAMLEKMFPKEGCDVPEIRFKGFDEPWKQHKLSEIAMKVSEKNTDLFYIETFTNSAEFGIISQRDFFDHDVAKLDKLGGYYVVRHEDFVYNPRISNMAPVGPINRNKLNKTGVMSPLYTVFRPYNINTTFLEYFFKGNYWHSYMYFNGDSGARSDRFSIKDNIFFEMLIPVPHIEEQKKIGDYFEKLDSLISFHQQELEKLKNIKTALLEKMFV